MRGLVVLVGLLALTDGARAESDHRSLWQEAPSAPAITRMWGAGGAIYGVGAGGAYRSTDGGATWTRTDGYGVANGVWGSDLNDIWIIRARTIYHSVDGGGWHWTTQQLPMLSFDATLEGMWGADGDRYLFGVDRSDGTPRGVILRSRDRGASWRIESLPIAVERIAAMWGSAANDVYAVGARGAIMRSTGDGTWQVVRQPQATTSSLEAIWGTNATNIYAVGTNGLILHSSDRGKTWMPRASNAQYTLSSIVGSGREILVGSADGQPLRSSDGLTWRPMTAMVGRGHVWIDRDRVVVAGPTGLQFLGTPTIPRRDPLQVRAFDSSKLNTSTIKTASCSDRFTIDDAAFMQAGTGQYLAALDLWEQVAHCDAGIALRAYGVACRAHAFGRAQRLFNALPSAMQDVQTCIHRGYDPRASP